MWVIGLSQNGYGTPAGQACLPSPTWTILASIPPSIGDDLNAEKHDVPSATGEEGVSNAGDPKPWFKALHCDEVAAATAQGVLRVLSWLAQSPA
eukprot:1857816-Amphidinium_carterae.1